MKGPGKGQIELIVINCFINALSKYFEIHFPAPLRYDKVD